MRVCSEILGRANTVSSTGPARSRRTAAAAALTCVAFASAALPASASAGPVSFKVVPCPATQGTVGTPTPPPIAPTVAVTPTIAYPPGASMYGTAFSPGSEPFAWVLAPSGFSCSAFVGVDSARGMDAVGSHNHDRIRAVFIPGGRGFLEELACLYIPAARAAVAKNAPTPSYFATLCTPPPSQDAIMQLPTGSSSVMAAAVRVPPGGSFPTGEPTRSTDPTLAVVSTRLGGNGVEWSQAISCTLPAAQQPMCAASLALFLTQTLLGRALSQSQLAATLTALDTFLKVPVAFQPSEPCETESIGLKLSSQANAAIFQVGGEDTIEWGRRSDAKWDVNAQGKFKVGLGGVFGDSVQTSFGGGAGAGAQTSVAAGLSLGLGFGFETVSGQGGRTLVDALTGPNAAPPQGGVQLTSTTLSIGAWLSGDVGVSSADGHLDAEGVLGVKTDFEEGREVDNEYYLEGNVAANVVGSVPVGSIAVPLSGGGFLEGSLLVGEVINTAGEPTSGEVELTAGAGATGGAGVVEKILHGLVNVASGQEADVKLTLPLDSTQSRSAWSALISGHQDEYLPGLVGGASASNADDALAKAMTMTAVLYEATKGSGSISAKFGEGIGAGLQVEGEASYKHAIAAEAKAPGTLQSVPWAACLGTSGPTS